MHHDAPDTRLDAPRTHRFVPVAEAARMLGLSATTIRRKIDAGELEAERVVRPQGTAFLVKVPWDAPPRAGDAPASPQDASETNRDAPGGAEQFTSVVLPLIAQIDGLRLAVERQAEQLVSQAETIGRQSAELRHARARIAELEPAPDPFPRPSPPSPNAEPSRWRRWWLAVAGAVLVLVVGASCQQASSVKHAGLWSAARTSMDSWSKVVASQRMLSDEYASGIRASVDIAEKVCRVPQILPDMYVT